MKIIAFEGNDGSGKGTQFTLFENYLKISGKIVASLSFPVYEGFFGKEIGNMLSGVGLVRADIIDPKSMSLWYALDRLTALNTLDYKCCDYLLLNRYTLSSVVYQSIRATDFFSNQDLKHAFAKWVMYLEHDELKLPEPDIYCVFNVDSKTAQENVEKKGFRDYTGDKADIYESSSDLLTRVQETYIEYSKLFTNMSVIECIENGQMLPKEQILEKTVALLENLGII